MCQALSRVVQRYIDQQIRQGYSLVEVAEIFQQPVLPASLTQTKVNPAQIRRMAQLILTEAIKHQHQDSAKRQMERLDYDTQLFGFDGRLL